MMKARDIRELEISDIDQKVDALKKELHNLSHQSQTTQVEKPHRFAQLRKEIAICKTIVREKELSHAKDRQ